MLAYAADRPTIAARRSSPHGFLFIATVHVIAIAVLVSVKMDLPARIASDPIDVEILRPESPDPTEVPKSSSSNHRTPADPTAMPTPVPLPSPIPLPNPLPLPDLGPVTYDPPAPVPVPLPAPAGETRGPSLATSADALKPPYPQAKLLLEEEASLTLRLSIDKTGRVVAVEPVGRADRLFLEAARRHLLAHWRYRPALKDGQAVAATIVTTLHFRLDD